MERETEVKEKWRKTRKNIEKPRKLEKNGKNAE